MPELKKLEPHWESVFVFDRMKKLKNKVAKQSPRYLKDQGEND